MYALGTFINAVVERTEHANTVDHSVVMALLKHSVRDGSPMVRRVSNCTSSRELSAHYGGLADFFLECQIDGELATL